jgi:hypothetical protein
MAKPKEKRTFYVDIPTEDCINNPDGAYKNVATFDTKEAAIKWAQEQFGADKQGRVQLVVG